MCEFHDCNCNGLGDIWWTDKCMYFSSIDDGINEKIGTALVPYTLFTLPNLHAAKACIPNLVFVNRASYRR